MTFQLNQLVTIQLRNSWTYSPPVEGWFIRPPPRQAAPATPPVEGECFDLFPSWGHHPVRLRLPPLRRRGMF